MKGNIKLFFMLNQRVDEKIDSGFTLVEVLLAIVLLGIITTTLFVSYKSLFTARAQIDNKVNILSQSKTVINRVVDDLTGFYCELRPLYKEVEEFNFKSKYFFVAESQYSGEKTSSKLNFTSYSHLGFGGDDIKSPAEIFYFLKDNILYRGDFIYPYPETIDEKEEKSYPICKNVNEFKLVFYDEEGDEYQSWDSDDVVYGFSTPCRVYIKIETLIESEKEVYETEIKLPVFREKKS